MCTVKAGCTAIRAAPQPPSSDNNEEDKNENTDNQKEQTTDVEKRPGQEIVEPPATTESEKNNVIKEQYEIGDAVTVGGNQYKVLAGNKVSFLGANRKSQKSLPRNFPICDI